MRLFLFVAATFCCFWSNGQELERYRMYSDHFDIKKYTKQYQRAFDEEGIITQKKQYHALTISLYGIMCYDAFIKTGDSSYYYEVKNQYKYFNDTIKLDFAFDGKGVGLPYKFKFHDLRAPWYSGLTQGIAVSFLLRYALLTGDESAKELAEKVNYFMLQKVEDGGTISRTPEGNLWIEEYPGTKRSKQVLNGFINGLVGLKEYCDFFPKDTTAARIHADVYASFKKSLPLYDLKNNWTSYDRNGKKISVAYLRIQLTQLDHLYQLYEDDFLRKQMMIWGMMLNSKKDRELKFYLKPEYRFSESMKYEKQNQVYGLDFTALYDSILVSNEGVETGLSKKRIREHVPARVFKKRAYIDLPIAQTYLQINTGKMPSKFDVYVQLDGGEEVVVPYQMESDKLTIQFEEPYKSIRFKSKSRISKRFQFHDIRYYNYRSLDIPMFGYQTVNRKISLETGKKYNVTLNSNDATDLTIFYKIGKDEKELVRSKWHWTKTITDLKSPFEPTIDGFYQFFVSYSITNPKSSFGELIFEEAE